MCLSHATTFKLRHCQITGSALQGIESLDAPMPEALSPDTA